MSLPRVVVIEDEKKWQNDHFQNLKDWNYEPYIPEGSESISDQFNLLWNNAIFLAQDKRCHIAIVDMRLKKQDKNNRSGLEIVPYLAPTISIIVSNYGDRDTVSSALKPSIKIPQRPYYFVGKQDGPAILKQTIEDVISEYWPRFTKEPIKWPFSIGGSEQVIKRLFPDRSDIPADEIDDLLWRLYPDAQQLAVHSLESDDRFPSTGSVRPRSIIIRVNEDGNTNSDIVKIVRRDPTRDESSRYKKYVEGKFPLRHHATLKSEAMLWDVQATRYSNVGDVGTLFRIYYREKPTEDICTVLENFGSGWKSYYDRKKEKGDDKVTLYQAYSNLWGSNWHKRFGASTGALEEMSSELQAWFSEQLKLTDPMSWLKQRIVLEQVSEAGDYMVSKDYSPQSIPMCVIHGDLQADNCFIDEQTKLLWLIDFERSGPGPIFADWVELEVDLLTRLLRVSATEPAEFLKLVASLLSPDPKRFWDPDLPPGVSEESKKAFMAIKTIRKHAKATSGEDTKLYRWALLLNTAFRLTLPMRNEDNPIDESDLPLAERCILLGGVICRSLESGSTDVWPPKGWNNHATPSLPPELSPPSSTASNLDYDVFISYSSKDRDWVIAELLPRLKAANLKVCIDFADFEPASPAVIEMERAIKTSRKTLAVMTQNYLESGWTEFENLMLQTLDPANRKRRFVPLLKEKIELPLRIKYLVYVDFADPVAIDLSWQRLLKTLTPPKPELPLS